MTEAASPPPPEQAERAPLARWRVILVWSLVVVASILLLISSLTIWVRRQVIDSDGYTNTAAQLLENSEIRTTLATYLTNTLYENVDVNAILQKELPPRLQPLAPVAAGALPQLTDRAANRLLASPRVEDLWVTANRRAHDAFIAILDGKKTGHFLTANGAVALDLQPLVQKVASSGGLGQKLTAQLPPNAGTVTIISSDQLDQVQKAVKVLRALSVFLALAAFGLYALAIFLARGRRRNLLRGTAASFLFVGVVVLILRSLLGPAVVDSLVKTDSVKPAANAAWSIFTSMLQEIGVALVVFGAVVLVGAWLAGPTRPAVAIRRWLAPSFRERAGLVFGVVGFVYLLVVLWGPVPALQRWWGILLLGGLVFLGVWALRRETLREFPPGATA